MADYAMLVKMRLTSLVVFTAVGAYYVATGLDASLASILTLALGGFGVAGASNAINQVLEKDYDKLMKRTAGRPLPSERMSTASAVLFAGMLCLMGITALATFNVMAAFTGMLAFVLYAFVYTPMKRYSRAAVFVGAVAGAMPMLIGVVAYSGELTILALLLFAIQFAWQYPHFWSIAFLGHEDYSNAGFNFVPTNADGSIQRNIASSSIAYAVLLIGLCLSLYVYGYSGVTASVVLGLMTAMYLFYSVKFYKEFDLGSAKQLMFSSLMYIPMVLIVLIIDKLF